jgi:hypothetical protein
MKKGWTYDNCQRATLEVSGGYFVSSSGVYTNTTTASVNQGN